MASKDKDLYLLWEHIGELKATFRELQHTYERAGELVGVLQGSQFSTADLKLLADEALDGEVPEYILVCIEELED